MFFHPFPLQITEKTSVFVGGFFILWLVFVLHQVGGTKNYMPGKEYGTARIASYKELNKKLEDKDPSRNKILSEHLRISTNTRKTGLNNNTIIIGGSGSGKSFNMVKPNGYNAVSSYLFCDPKGELLRDIGNYLEIHGYRIIVLNLVDMDASGGYNPFEYIRCDEDIVKLITNLIANTTPKGANSSDPFWEKSEGMYLQSLMYYVWYEFPKQGRTANFRGLLELLNKAKIPENEKEQSELDVLMNALPEDHPALIAYKKVRVGAVDTVRSIIISANSRLAYLQNPKVLRILDKDDMHISFMGEGVYENPERKTALFCVIPDNDKSYNFIVGLLYTQIFQELYFVADHKYGGRLPVPVALWMDEFANVALPDGFCEILSTMRSREISCNIIIQNLAQIKALFKDTWETITGNCDSLVYLGGNEQSTHKYMSEMLGKVTIDKKSSGETLGSHGSASRNYDVLGRELLAPDEVRKLDNKKCMIFVRGFDPVIDEKYQTHKKEEYKTAVMLGPYVHKAERNDLYQEEQRQFYIDLSGMDKEKSFHFQVEQYGGIFEEAAFFNQAFVYEEEYLIMPKEYGSYMYGGEEVYPVFFNWKKVRIKSGGNVLVKHEIAGYWNGTIFTRDEKAVTDCIFMEKNRACRVKTVFGT